MEEKAKPKRKYTRKPKVEPLAVYSVMVKVTKGRKTETIYAESTRVENGCLVIVSMDGPQPLVERTRYIPFGSAEIEVCQRPQPAMRWLQPAQPSVPSPPWTITGAYADQQIPTGMSNPPQFVQPSGPRIELGPLEMARQMGQGQAAPPPARRAAIVERNAEGLPVVMGGFTDSGGGF